MIDTAKRIPARKQPEYECLAQEIEQLQREANKQGDANKPANR